MKTRSDAKLLNMPEEQQAQLAEWLLSGMPYHRARPLIEKDFGITTSMGALSSFFEQVCTPMLLSRRQRAVTTADQVADEAARIPGRFDQATIDALKQKAFELSISPGSDPRDVKSLFMLVLKARDQDLKQTDISLKMRRLELLERNAAAAKDKLTQAVSKGGLAPETLKTMEEALNLL